MARTIRVSSPPHGFRYEAEALSRTDEKSILSRLELLELKEFEFQGYLGKRRVRSFGWRYDFGDYSLQKADPIPEFLLPVRDLVARFAGRESESFVHVLVTEYKPGTTIGWHRDRDVFGEVVGVSLLSTCIFRFRQRLKDVWERYSLALEPRSIYLLRDSVRHDWEHSIPAVDRLRYSITFRTLRDDDRKLHQADARTIDAGRDEQLSFDF